MWLILGSSGAIGLFMLVPTLLGYIFTGSASGADTSPLV